MVCLFSAGNKAKSKFAVQTAPLKASWDPPLEWSNSTRKPKISWALRHKRAPICKYEYDNYMNNLGSRPEIPLWDPEDNSTRGFHGKLYEKCCVQKQIIDERVKSRKKIREKDFDPECDHYNNARIRFTSSEVGYMYNFDFDPETGLPKGNLIKNKSAQSADL